jgi:hypothetical protein
MNDQTLKLLEKLNQFVGSDAPQLWAKYVAYTQDMLKYSLISYVYWLVFLGCLMYACYRGIQNSKRDHHDPWVGVFVFSSCGIILAFIFMAVLDDTFDTIIETQHVEAVAAENLLREIR